MEFEPHGLGFQLPRFFFFFFSLCTKDTLISFMTFLFLCDLYQTQAPYTCIAFGVQEFLVSLQIRPQGQCSEPPMKAGAIFP